jgi:hypothetical protein
VLFDDSDELLIAYHSRFFLRYVVALGRLIAA